jgi:phage repressor protein C with HTH and peptisase S24 domain
MAFIPQVKQSFIALSSADCFRLKPDRQNIQAMLEGDELKKLVGRRVRGAVEGYSGTQADLANACGVTPQAITGWFQGKISKASVRKLAAATALDPAYLLGMADRPRQEQSTDLSTDSAVSVHKPESAGETAPGYRRLGLLDAVAGMGQGTDIVESPEVIREMDFSELQLRNLIGFLPRPGRLQLMTGRGTSMEPVIKPGDVVIVDTGCNHFDGDGIYVINAGRGVQIKALQDRGDGVWVVSANPTYPPFRADDELVIVGKVYVRNRLDRLD